MCVCVCVYSIFLFKIHFPRNKDRIGFTKKLSDSNCTSKLILIVITSCIIIDNGMKVKTDSGCASIEYDIYLKESEC